MVLRTTWTRRCMLLLSAGFGLSTAYQSLHAAEYVVKLKGYESNFADTFSQFTEHNKVKVLDTHKDGQLVLIDMHDNKKFTLADQMHSLLNQESVEYVVPNFRFHTLDTPNDPMVAQQWALAKVNATQAWEYSKGSRKVVVAVVDTGVDTEHEDLKANIWTNVAEIPGNGIDDDGNGFVDDVHGWDFKDNDNNPNDETGQNPGHGTHCSGIVGAVGNNGKGISGISQAVSIMPVRFLGADGSGDLMGAVKSIDYATNNHANIISASWGAAVSRDQAAPIIEAIDRARQKGVLFVAAASNDGKNNDGHEVYPANAGLANVITVAASNSSDAKPTWSNYGWKVDLAAPGEGILSTIPNNQYKDLSGTSMATPLVSGSAALVLAHAQAKGLTMGPQEVKAYLQSTGAKVEIETACQCRIDVEAALKNVENSQLIIVPNAANLAPQATTEFRGFGGAGAPYSFASSNPDIASIDAASGVVTAKAEGQTILTVKDSKGNKADSRVVRVAVAKEGGGKKECPLGEQQLCDVLCQVNPQLPWCK